jgi:NADP-dependent 3-hydroxy acid dehydrogenase YdfG
MSEAKIALVTGASSGFGQATAILLSSKGYRVFGTSRKEQRNAHPNVHMLLLDVRSESSVHECIGRLFASAKRIDLLVNNAGEAHVSPAEETSLTEATRIIDTNFFGVVRVTNAVLPFMRQQRAGRIINVGSLAGLVGVPGQAFYSASKFALEGYSEALAMEVHDFNINVSLIEPGFYKTHLHESVTHDSHEIPDYNAMRGILQESIRRSIVEGDDPQEVAELIARVAVSGSPKLRYRVGSGAVWVPRLKTMVPEKSFQRGMRRRFNLL